MSTDFWSDLIATSTRRVGDWERLWPEFVADDSVAVSEETATKVLGELAERLRDNYPFFHPSYAGQMLKPPHPIAAAAFAMAQRINPNAHALDGGPATAQLELEVIRELIVMCGLPVESSLGHLTSSGTIANLEALWVAREVHPTRGIVFSESAHYTHERMCQVLRMSGESVHATRIGQMDLDALEEVLRTGRVGTVVSTAGTTSLGAVDPIDGIVELARTYNARVHVDAAYGGFFRLLSDDHDSLLEPNTSRALKAISDADSVVIDPHKHGLQPYGCGSVLFRDASVGQFYKHDSPYTYFTSDELHLGEISLECSRAGAAAAALWATLQALPLESHCGIGAILRQTRSAALRWSDIMRDDPQVRLVIEPELDILGFYCLPSDGSRRASEITTETQRRFASLMNGPRDQQLFLATLRCTDRHLTNHDLDWDSDEVLVFRSVMMKPEHSGMVGEFHRRFTATDNSTVRRLPGDRGR